MAIEDDDSTESVELDEDFLNELSERLEDTINTLCEENSEMDPRLELLVTFGLFAAQVAVDTGYEKKEFINLMKDMFSDIKKGMEEMVEVDKSTLN